MKRMWKRWWLRYTRRYVVVKKEYKRKGNKEE